MVRNDYSCRTCKTNWSPLVWSAGAASGVGGTGAADAPAVAGGADANRSAEHEGDARAWRDDFWRRYAPGACLGKGTFGEVSAVIHKESGLPYALKRILRKDFPGEHEDLHRELEMSETLPKHKNLIQAFCTCSHPDVAAVTDGKEIGYILMELAMTSLHKELKRQRFQVTPSSLRCT